jgi:hypothetical protein
MARPRKKRSPLPLPKSKPDKLDPDLMAKVCFEVKYLSGRKNAQRTKGQILNEYEISYDSYYNWLKKLDPRNPQYDSSFHALYKELVAEFFLTEDEGWLRKSRETYLTICEFIEAITQRLMDDLREEKEPNLKLIECCLEWGIKTQEMYITLKDIDQTRFLVGVGEKN